MSRPAPLSRYQIWVHWLVYPGHSLPTAAAPVLVAMGLAVHDHVFAPGPALAAFLASWFIHIAGLFTDNHELLVKYPHVDEHPELTAALEDGTLSLARLRWAIATCLGLAALTGPYLLHVAGTPVVAIGLVGIAGSLGYAAGPFPSAKHGLADVHFFAMFGVIAPAAAYYVQLASIHGGENGWNLLLHGLPAHAFLVGLPLGAFAVKILIIDDVRDRAFDAAKGWRTTPVRLGIGFSRAEYVLLSAFIYLMPFWFWLGLGFSAWVLLPLATLPFDGALARMMFARERHDDLVPLTPMAAMLCLAYAALLAAGLAVSQGG
ncbi:MAG TPA: UbiA family prenyltransferase [Xanthobacteraceae bacterium]|nr:UbiA family prenyltransferase [Xanthobacteraceae bacterium]